jgi:molecular chaperone DnaK
MSPTIGIDLGTTNSVAAYTDSDGVTTTIAGTEGDRIVPSVVHFPEGGDPVVGTRAKQHAVVDPNRVAQLFKRGMGEKTFQADEQPFEVDGKTWSPEELSSLVLRKLKQMAEQYLGEPVTKAVITVPAYFGQPERAATRDAGELAGLEVERIINEPTAAALAHGVDQGADPGKVLVFDLGGGTFDVTLMQVGQDRSMEVIATGGDRKLGGADFDQRILDRMSQAASAEGVDLAADPWALSDAVERAEALKKELSTVASATCRITAGGRPLLFSLTRDEFEAAISDKLQEVEDTVRHTIETAGVEPTRIGTILMVGGSSRIPAFQRLLASICGKEPKFSRNLDEDVARGAAILAAKLGGELDPRSQLATLPQPVDAASHGFGISIQVDDAGNMANEVMIRANEPIPAEVSRVFGAVHDGQTEIKVDLNEGEDADLDFVRELGSSTGQFSRPVSKGYPVRVDMSYTADQFIRVKAYDGQTEQFLCELEVHLKDQMSKEEKSAARRYLARLDVS